MELKGLYPKCKFLALDPDSFINEDLVKNKLNGTFIQKVIGAEDSNTANIKANLMYEERLGGFVTLLYEFIMLLVGGGFLCFIIFFPEFWITHYTSPSGLSEISFRFFVPFISLPFGTK